MKKTGKVMGIVALVLTVVLVSTAGLVGGMYLLRYSNQLDLEESVDSLFGFYKSADANADLVDAETLWQYESAYPQLYATMYWDMLAEDADRLIYKAYMYAFENAYVGIAVPQAVVNEQQTPSLDLLTMLALDTPLVQQNLLQETGNYSSVVSQEWLFPWLSASVEISGTYLQMDFFDEASLLEKQEAMKKADAVLQELPQGLDDLEKAKYIYRYVTENIRYYTYEEDAKPNYLYDALVGGKSNCDGYSNALSLLLGKAGLQNYEICYQAPNVDEEGHVWNVLVLNGVHYMLDATMADSTAHIMPYVGFGITDEMASETYLFREKLPAYSTDSIAQYDAVLDSTMREKTMLERMQAEWDENGKQYLYLKIRGEAINVEKIVQAFVNHIGGSVTYYANDEAGRGECYLLICP